MSQEQKAEVEQGVGTGLSRPVEASEGAAPVEEVATPQASASSEAEVVTPTKKKRTKKRMRIVTEEEISPHPSYWPLLLALAIVVVLIGAVTNLIILAVGALCVLAAVIGWAVERR